ncbi:MAG: DUF1501 domain-containing protein [Verrucomicrobiae bacterium]|nr:DUF1501 domain-containing protein [Verrucomicrobiae bacterium]
MKRTPPILTRRQFLRRGAIVGALTWTIPVFLDRTMATLQAAALDAVVSPATGRDGRILVLLQLAGGNDGLNAVAPVGDDDYHRARPTLGIADSAALRLGERAGLHPDLVGLKALWDDGHLGVVQAVGYPNPNRSHFRSTDIWQTASDANRSATTGWVGRFFDSCCAGAPASVGLGLGGQMPLAFAAKSPKGVIVENTGNRARKASVGDGPEVAMDEPPASEGESEGAGGSIGMLAGELPPSGGSPLDFVRRTELDARVSREQIAEIAAKAKGQGSYPATRLGQELAFVARLIAGGMVTRVYYVSQGGYDTHTNQKGAHERLLRELGDALRAFAADLKAQGNFDRVLLMTFSEFGRRVKENGSGGTDHGAGAPLFALGGGVKAGLHGEMPSLAAEHLDRGDVAFRTDFRSVYATVLEKHLGVPSSPILGRAFPLLGLL